MDKIKSIIYIAQTITPNCVGIRKNYSHLSQAALNRSIAFANLIKNQGYNVIIASPSPVNRKTAKIFWGFHEEFKNCKIFHATVWDIPGVHLISAIFSLIFWLVRNRSSFDQVFFYNYRPETAVPAFFSKIFLRKKIFLEYEDGFFSLRINPIIKIVINSLEKTGNFLISGATVVNEKLARRLKTKNVQFIPGLIDREIINSFNKLSIFRRKNKVIMFSGTLDEIRGVDIFIKLGKKIIQNLEGDYEFWITGKGPYENIVMETVEQFPDKFCYFGFLSHDELIERYKNADAFVSLQKPDLEFSDASYPSKIYEYLSTGKPVIGIRFSHGKQSEEEVYQEMLGILQGTFNKNKNKKDICIVDRVNIFDKL